MSCCGFRQARSHSQGRESFAPLCPCRAHARQNQGRQCLINCFCPAFFVSFPSWSGVGYPCSWSSHVNACREAKCWLSKNYSYYSYYSYNNNNIGDSKFLMFSMSHAQFPQAMDKAYSLTKTGNSEVRFCWHRLCLRARALFIVPHVLDFVTSMVRVVSHGEVCGGMRWVGRGNFLGETHDGRTFVGRERGRAELE